MAEQEPNLHAVLESFEHELRTQDNRITAEPIFMVQERQRIYGFDADYTEHIAFLLDDYEVTAERTDDPEEKWEEHEGYYQEHGEPKEGWTRTGYLDRWENIQPFLTEQAADEYIRLNHHRHKPLRIYVESAYRNAEWQALRRLLGGELCQALAAERERCAAVIAGVAKRYWDQGHIRESDGVTEALVEVRGMS